MAEDMRARSYFRFSMGSHGRGSGPTYSAAGRMILLSCLCSMMWADHPDVRAMTKRGVNIDVGIAHAVIGDRAHPIDVGEHLLSRVASPLRCVRPPPTGSCLSLRSRDVAPPLRSRHGADRRRCTPDGRSPSRFPCCVSGGRCRPPLGPGFRSAIEPRRRLRWRRRASARAARRCRRRWRSRCRSRCRR